MNSKQHAFDLGVKSLVKEDWANGGENLGKMSKDLDILIINWTENVLIVVDRESQRFITCITKEEL